MRAGRGVLAALALLASVGWSAVVDAGHGGSVMALDVDYVNAQYAKGRKLTAIDLRSPEAYGRGHLPGARSLPLEQLTSRFAEVPRSDLVVLYCDCARSEVEVAYWFLRGKQYRNLSVLEQGFAGWVERGHPIEK
jgi:rhodanese-related sulfurtransferase